MEVTCRQIFEHASGNQFVGTEQLPEPQKHLNGFRAITIQTVKGMPSEEFLKALIIALGGKPKYGGAEIRTRQFSSLLKAHTENSEKLIFTIHDSHLLPPRTIKSMKTLGEITQKAGFVFLGNMNKFEKKLTELEDMKPRIDILRPADTIEPRKDGTR